MARLWAALAVIAAIGGSASAMTRDYVWIAAPPAVFPFASGVAENFAQRPGVKAPKVDAPRAPMTVFDQFCKGAGPGFPDIAATAHPIRRAEFDACDAHGVKDLVEVKIGYDGFVLAVSRTGPDYRLRLDQLFFGLARQVPVNRQLSANPYKNWEQIAPKQLPTARISVFGPPDSGARQAFLTLGVRTGADRMHVDVSKIPDAALLRDDHVWNVADENDDSLVQRLLASPGALAVIHYRRYQKLSEQLKAAEIDGVSPSGASLASGKYPLARTLYLYVKKSQLAATPGLQGFIEEFWSEPATGHHGYLIERGFVPLPRPLREREKQALEAAKPISRPAA